MTGNPTVSVIIPTYNRAHLLRRSINSVLEQTFTDFELIIVDDCSTDSTNELLKTYGDPRIRYLKNSENLGAGRSRNAGVAASNGKYIAFQDSDDEWLPQKLEKQIAEFKKSAGLGKKPVGMVYCLLLSIDLASQSQIMGGHCFNLSDDIFASLLIGPDVGTPTMLIERGAWDEIGGFSDEIHCFEDWEFSLRMAEKYSVILVNEVLLKAYVLENGINSNGPKRMDAEFFILNKYLHLFSEREVLILKLEGILRRSFHETNKYVYLKRFLETAGRVHSLGMTEALKTMFDFHSVLTDKQHNIF